MSDSKLTQPSGSQPWRVMTPEEYVGQYKSFGNHRAEIRLSVKNDANSAEVFVWILPFENNEVRDASHHHNKQH